MSRIRFSLLLACVALLDHSAPAASPGQEKEIKRQSAIYERWSEAQRPDEKVNIYYARLMDEVRYGNPKAMAGLGILFYKSGDVPRAVDWFKKSAEKGNALGAYYLATCYKSGTGVEKSAPLYLKWLQAAADSGLSEAVAELAIVYLQGAGVPPDAVKARALLEQAAAEGNPSALANLAHLEGRGIGGPPSVEKALKHYQEAAEAGLPDAYYSWGEALRILKKYDQAVAPYEQAIKGGIVWARVSLGLLYCDGLGVAKDRKKAAEYFAKAAEEGNTAAMGIMADWLRTGEWVKADEKKAKTYEEKCETQMIANPGDNSSSLLGGMLLEGNIMKKDLPKALRYLRMGAKAGNPTAQAQAGALLASGEAGDRDVEEAYVWLWLAARAGDKTAEQQFQALVEKMPADQIVKAAKRAEAYTR